MIFYRIAWRSLLTNHANQGQYVFTNVKELQNYVNQLNKDHAGEITHWLESNEAACPEVAANEVVRG